MTASGVISADKVDAAPDWATITDEVLCPLCEYNLRGLVEPRCPECGHQFVWHEVLDRSTHLHPYLFEHHPQRNVWSFFRTFFASLLPQRFWQTLRPIHLPNVRRLVIYWIVGVAIVALTLSPIIVVPVARDYANRLQARSMIEQTVADPVARRDVIARAGYNSPLLSAIQSVIRTRTWLDVEPLLTGVAWVVWPSLTFGSLLIYRITMRQAKINQDHVLRCVIYTANASLITAPLLIASSFLLSPGEGITIIVLVILPIMTYHLAVAYRRYLNFPHAILAVVASQLIVCLVFFNVHLHWLYR